MVLPTSDLVSHSTSDLASLDSLAKLRLLSRLVDDTGVRHEIRGHAPFGSVFWKEAQGAVTTRHLTDGQTRSVNISIE